MSHLPHVFAYKDKLESQGIVCPELLTNLVSEPFAAAIISYHFKFCSTIGMSEQQEAKVWNKLDDWNKVSPINAPLIMALVNDRMQSLKAQLGSAGKPCMLAFNKTVSNAEGNPVDVQDNEEFKVLLTYLVDEMVNCHE